MKIEESFYIGYITKTKGLKGEIQVYFEYDEFDELTFSLLYIEINGKLVPFFVSSSKLQQNKTGYFFLEDIDTIEKAEKLVKKKIYLPNSEKPLKNEDEFYYTDLKGFIAHDTKLGELGEITDVLEYPQQFIAVVTYNFREVMFPLNDDIIASIDEEEGTIELTLPEGLIDIYS
ncbi:ribosome maturation factor RimM [Pararcticibacter amylolyticus]|uniref:Ribosome maturation factor RimM n=1 Tax=Pararcticibacter amylolyticus TaxID=2173175 RepID=A0A2U2PIN0_9SPHI|nr:ribosome maturation factor RimM [Pararcticibacter amylolyticus]PWG81124.1 16S rRNA processing protein RimM [Pararcticibacter amylolyticus]